MDGRIEKLAGVMFTEKGVKLGGLPSIGSNVRATEERRLWVDWARGVVVLCVKMPPTDEEGERWATRYFPVAGGDILHMDPGNRSAPLDDAALAGTVRELLTPTSRAFVDEIVPGWAEREVRDPTQPLLRPFMTAEELGRRLPADSLRILAREGYVAYGEKAGPAGPWKTYDGRPMPTWGELHRTDGGEPNAAGLLTVTRWEAAGLGILEAALGLRLLEGVGFRPADAQVPAELVHYTRAAGDAGPGYTCERVDRLTQAARARVRRCIDGLLWLPFPAVQPDPAKPMDETWAVAPLEQAGQLLPDLGIITPPDAEEDARPVTVMAVADALEHAGYWAEPETVARWSLKQREEAYRFGVNEASGDATPIPEHVKGLRAVKPSPGSRAPDRREEPAAGGASINPQQPAAERRSERVGADTLNPTELVQVAATFGPLGTPAVTVRVSDLTPEQRAQLVRQPDGGLLYTPPAASEAGQQPAQTDAAVGTAQPAPSTTAPARAPRNPRSSGK